MANRRREQFKRWAPRVISDLAIFSPSSSRSLTPARAARRARLNVIVYYRVILRAPAGADAAMSVLYQTETIFSPSPCAGESMKNIGTPLRDDSNHPIHEVVENAHNTRYNEHILSLSTETLFVWKKLKLSRVASRNFQKILSEFHLVQHTHSYTYFNLLSFYPF